MTPAAGLAYILSIFIRRHHFGQNQLVGRTAVERLDARPSTSSNNVPTKGRVETASP